MGGGEGFPTLPKNPEAFFPKSRPPPPPPRLFQGSFQVTQIFLCQLST